MLEKYIIYIPDHYGINQSKYAVLTDGKIKILSAEDLKRSCDLYITYDVPTLIENMRYNNAKLPKELIDISDSLRLAIGISKADGGNKKWDYWKRIKPFFDSVENWKLAQALHEGSALQPKDDELIAILSSIGAATYKFWQFIKNLLKENGEYERFFEIEIPTAQIFYKRQMLGISIDQNIVKSCLEQASFEKYSAYKKIAEILNISPTGLTYWNVSQYLHLTDLPDISNIIEGYALRNYLKIARESSEFAEQFTSFMDSSMDVVILTQLSTDNARVFPIFNPLGTVSGRILVSEPRLQELRRKFRNVVTADLDQELFYFDYAQFEPGIMASLSADDDLIQIYNSGDVYAALSIALFETEQYRDLCKKIFLAFSYGMTANGIANLIIKKNGNEHDRNDIENRVVQFFNKFSTLENFKNTLENELLKNNCVASKFGNYRRRPSSGKLKSKEQRWAVNQMIQGTASLIFKKALIDLSKKFGKNSILLPMHDAILMQFPKNNETKIKNTVTKIMSEAFSFYCPQVRIKVTCSKFHKMS